MHIPAPTECPRLWIKDRPRRFELLRFADLLDGHSAGDKLIADTYHCIVKGFDRDHVFRIGGDEFVVLWANTNEAELAERTAIIRAAFRE